MNLSGTVLKGRYCILDPVGKGGGGKVLLILHKNTIDVFVSVLYHQHINEANS